MAAPGGGPPKILLAKPSAGPLPAKFGRGASDDETASQRSRLPPVGSLNLLSDSWDFHIDRFLPFLTENTDFTVVGVIGPTGVGKSTIMNEIYGFDGNSAGMLPPFATQSEESRAMAKHCTMGIEPRISAERFILLDTQPVFCPSILAEMIRPDGSSTVPVLGDQPLPAELAHELMSIQVGVLLASICHVLLVVSEGVHDDSMWHLMSTVDLLKHGIPDPSTPIPSPSHASNSGTDRESKDEIHESEKYMAAPIFVHTKLQDQDLAPQNITQMRKALGHYFQSHSFMRERFGNTTRAQSCSPGASSEPESTRLNSLVIPSKNSKVLHESYVSALWKLRDQVLSMKCPSFSRTISEREWLKNSAKIWELVKSSPIIAEYSKLLQSSGMFRR